MTGIALMMAALSSTASAAAYDSFPMDSGNFWIFDAPEGHRLIEVEDTDALGGGWYASDTEGLLAEPVTVYDSNTSDELIVDDGADLSALFDFGAADGDSWSFALSACDTYDVTAEFDGTTGAVTPAGTFSGLRSFALDHAPTGAACEDAPLSRIAFAEDVGPVRFTDAAGQRGRLMFAFVAGEVAAASAYDAVEDGDLSVTLVVNAAEVDGGSPTAVAVLRNTGDTVIDLTRGGFIIDIFDRVDGSSLRSAALGPDEAASIAAGDVKVLSATLDLTGLTGDLSVRATLQDGAFTAAPAVDVSR